MVCNIDEDNSGAGNNSVRIILLMMVLMEIVQVKIITMVKFAVKKGLINMI